MFQSRVGRVYLFGFKETVFPAFEDDLTTQRFLTDLTFKGLVVIVNAVGGLHSASSTADPAEQTLMVNVLYAACTAADVEEGIEFTCSAIEADSAQFFVVGTGCVLALPQVLLLRHAQVALLQPRVAHAVDVAALHGGVVDSF